MTTVKDSPILMCDPMALACLEGRKINTRRVINPQPTDWVAMPSGGRWPAVCIKGLAQPAKPRYPVGTLLWVREGVRCHDTRLLTRGGNGGWLWPRFPTAEEGGKWFRKCCYYTSSLPENSCVFQMLPAMLNKMFMPRWASRTTLEVTGVKVERLNDISEEDAILEGMQSPGIPAATTNRGAFALLWESINRKGSWKLNPWVWAYAFKKVKP